MCLRKSNPSKAMSTLDHQPRPATIKTDYQQRQRFKELREGPGPVNRQGLALEKLSSMYCVPEKSYSSKAMSTLKHQPRPAPIKTDHR